MSISKFFETKYKIMRDPQGWYIVHFRWWWCPFWFPCLTTINDLNAHNSYEDAEEFAQQKMSGEYGRKSKPQVISYLN